jgi:hypothetical protein
MSVLHVIHRAGGGTQKYLDDLMKITGYTYQVYHGKSDIENLDKVRLIHVHSLFPYDEIGLEFLQLLRYLRHILPEVKVFVTVHDYYYIFENSPLGSDIANLGFTTEWHTTSGNKPNHLLCYCARDLFRMADKVIIPTQWVYNNYVNFTGPLDDCNVSIVPHCDMPVRYEQLWVPPVTDKVRVAIVGKKGFDVYEKIKEVSNLPVEFVEYFTYNDEELIETLHRDNIHIILWPSRLEETYCYALTRLINSGIPIVYIRRGAFADRLPVKGRFFGTVIISNILVALSDAIQFVHANQGKKDYVAIDETVQLNDWYKENYRW